MRLVAMGVLLAVAPACAQLLVDERRLGQTLARFDDTASPDTLRCGVSPIHPQLNYGFRYQAGYVLTVPMNQFEGAGHRWRMLTRITPEGGDGKPVYLVTQYALPTVPPTKIDAQVGGGYLLGEGNYAIRHLLIDEQNRVCRKDWKVDVHRGRSESKVKLGIPADTVWDLALRGSRNSPPPVPDDAAPVRLTIMLHAAPTFARRTRLRQNDILTLQASVSAVLEHVPVKSVRLVAFNLDLQKEIYRKDNFVLRDLPSMSDAMNKIELGLVDLKVLANRRGHVETIADLVNQEIKSETPPDVVLFLGPLSRYFDKVPQQILEKPEGMSPRFLFFQLVGGLRGAGPGFPMGGRGGGGRGGPPPVAIGAPPPGMVMAEATVPDSIRNAVSKLGGKTFVIRSPGDLAKAIDRLEKK